MKFHGKSNWEPHYDDVIAKIVSFYGHFSYNSLVKFHGKSNWEPHYDDVVAKIVSFYGHFPIIPW